MPCAVPYAPSDPEHTQRAHKLFTDAMGVKRVPGRFQTMLTRVGHVKPQLDFFKFYFIRPQGTKVLEDREIRHDFCELSEGAPPQAVSPRISKYIGSLVSPEWIDVEEGTVLPFLVIR